MATATAGTQYARLCDCPSQGLRGTCRSSAFECTAPQEHTEVYWHRLYIKIPQRGHLAQLARSPLRGMGKMTHQVFFCISQTHRFRGSYSMTSASKSIHDIADIQILIDTIQPQPWVTKIQSTSPSSLSRLRDMKVSICEYSLDVCAIY